MQGPNQSHKPNTKKNSGRWINGQSNLSEHMASFFRLPNPVIFGKIGYKSKYPLLITPFHDWLLSRKAIPNLAFTPTDPWLGDANKGRAILAGQIELAGQIINNPAPLWNPVGAEPDWVKEFHSFNWLRSLRAAAGDQARRTAREMLNLWIKDNNRWHHLTWEPSITGCRLYNWLGHYEFIGSSADIDLRQRIHDSLAKQGQYLSACLPAGLTGVELIRAIKGLLYAGVCLPEGSTWLRRALNLLGKELSLQVLPDGGHIQRSPHIHLEVLRHLIDIRATLHAGKKEVPGSIISAIESMSPVLRMFLHGDGGLCLFNDSNEDHGWQIDMVLRRSEGRKQPLLAAPQSGFQRLQSGRIVVIVDAGAPPPPGYDLTAHAGTLSFEMSVGRERLITNCGVHRNHPQWRWIPRATAAHTTLTLAETNSAHLTPHGGLAKRPDNVTCRREEDNNGQARLEMSHDGYLNKLGLFHNRTLIALAKGEGIEGCDSLNFSENLDERVRQEFATRFHLHSDVKASLINGGDAVLLSLQKGGGWQFSCEGATLSLEPSIYLGKAGEIRRSQQIVLSGITTSTNKTEINWSLVRVNTKKSAKKNNQSNLWDQ
ncbi:heparinase II/III family protein [Kiloniella sp. EL199]|uniref:heparinase II/III family protein n=1 Tax=Kiloniella sp. EL199 TaxID=2107581 RepID=UPI000EA36AE5|nr:heparinase II/III family protein [Kiloniella sp. EL199]